MNINNEEEIQKNLNELIVERFQYRNNTEELRREILSFIGKYFYEYENENLIFDKISYLKLINNTKISYYRALVSQSQLSIKDKNELIDKFILELK